MKKGIQGYLDLMLLNRKSHHPQTNHLNQTPAAIIGAQECIKKSQIDETNSHYNQINPFLRKVNFYAISLRKSYAVCPSVCHP